MTGAIDKLFVTLGAKSTLGEDFGKAKRQVSNLDNHIKTYGDKMGAAFKKIGLAAAVGIGAIGTGVVAVGKGMLKGAGEVERYRAILETVTGSAQVAGEKLQWLTDFAARTPFELSGLMEAATKLESYGFKAEEFMGVLGDTSAALGKDVNAAVEALADATMGEFERLKEFGIKATTEGSQIAFNYVDKNGQQQKAMVDKNNKDMIASTLQSIWNERYGGAMEKMSTTWEGMVSNMEDAFSQGMAKAGDSIMPQMKDAIAKVTSFLSGPAFASALDSVGGMFSRIIDNATRIATAIEPLITPIMDALGPVMDELGSAVADIAQSMVDSGLVDAIVKFTSAFSTAFIEAVASVALNLVPIATALLNCVTPIVAIADKAGILEALMYAYVASKIWTTIGGITSALSGMAGALPGIAANSGTAATGLAGMGASAGALGLVGAAVAVVAYESWELEKAIRAYMKANKEMREANATAVDSFNTMYGAIDMKRFSGDTTHAINTISADFLKLGLTFDESGGDMNAFVKEMGDYFRDWQGEAQAAGANISTVPPVIGKAFDSLTPQIRTAAEMSMQGYLQAILEKVPEAQGNATAIADSLLAGLMSGDEAAMGAAKGTMEGYLLQLVEQGVITEQRAWEITQSIVAAMNQTGAAEAAGASVGDAFGQSLADALAAWFPTLDAMAQRKILALNAGFMGAMGGGTWVDTNGDGEPDALKHQGGLVYHTGGLIRHQGGAVYAHQGRLMHNEVMVRAKRGEYVIQESAVNKYGVAAMNRINAGVAPQGGGGGGTTITLTGDIYLPNATDYKSFIREAQLAGLRIATGA